MPHKLVTTTYGTSRPLPGNAPWLALPRWRYHYALSKPMVEPGVLRRTGTVQDDLQPEIMMMRCRSESQIVIFQDGVLSLPSTDHPGKVSESQKGLHLLQFASHGKETILLGFREVFLPRRSRLPETDTPPDGGCWRFSDTEPRPGAGEAWVGFRPQHS